MSQFALVCNCGLAYSPDAWLQMIIQGRNCDCGATENNMHHNHEYDGPLRTQSDVWLPPTEEELQKARDLMIPQTSGRIEDE